MRRHKNLSEKTTDYVYEIGLQLTERPDEDEFPELPEDLTTLSEQELMRQFRRFVVWQNYAAAQLALLEVDEEARKALTQEEEALSYLESSEEVFKSDLNSRAPVGTLIKAQRDADEEVRRQRDEQRVVYAKRKLVESIYESLDRSARLISRELTRRTESSSVESRSSRWGGA